ncbi:hypothetical protein D3C71_1742430 [compost metagenome]
MRILLMNSVNGSAPSSIRSTRICLPRFQVLISKNSTPPASTGNAPPWTILGTLAAKNSPSTNRKPTNIGTASTGGHFHSNSITADTRIVVISMVPVTATP